MIPVGLKGIAILVPVINPAGFTVASPQNAGFTVGQVFASNFPTNWTILSGDPLGNFAINSAGNITLANQLSGSGSATLTVQASNAYGNSAPGIVTIQWGAVPVITPASFSFTAPLAQGAAVGTMSATGSPTWSIQSGDPLGDFAINSATGAITAAQAIASSSSGNETLVVQAANVFGMTQANVQITWTASQATAPVITNALFSETLPTTVGTAIAQMQATQNPTSWALINGNYNGYYSLNTVTGLISAAAPALVSNTNLVLQSQTLQTTWISVGGSVTTIGVNQAIAPDGTQTADFLGEDTTTNEHRIFQSVNKPGSSLTYTMSLFALKQTRTRILLHLNDGGEGNFASAVFDLAGGQIGVAPSTFGTGFTVVGASITPVGNGWYRCVLIATTNTTTTAGVDIGIDGGSGTGPEVDTYAGGGTNVGLYVWGVQLEQASSVGPYIPTTTTSVSQNGQQSAVNTLTLTATNAIGTSAPGTAQITAINPAQLPAVSGSPFTVVLPLTTNQTIGTMTATNPPINSWSIIAGDPSGNFAISNAGVVSVTAAGAAAITTAQSINLTIKAINIVGSGTGTCTINVQTPAQATDIQLVNQEGPAVSVNFLSATNAGDLVGVITVDPSGYTGTITLSGTNAADFSLSSSSNVSSAAYPCNLYVAQGVNLSNNVTYTITVTASP
jgi:hypothetical protein